MRKKTKILLVEDDTALVRMYERRLKKDGFSVRSTFNGEEGLASLKANGRPDIILMDIMMPNMSGIDALKVIKADPVYEDIPVVILTNLGDREEDIKRCKKLGAADYWVKVNLRVDELAEKVMSVLSEAK